MGDDQTDGPAADGLSREPRAVQAALDQLAEALAGSEFRAALRENPKRAASDAGIDVGDLPEGLLVNLAVMSEQELRVVAHVQQLFQGSFRDDLASVAILF